MYSVEVYTRGLNIFDEKLLRIGPRDEACTSPKCNSRGSTYEPLWLAESPLVLESRALLKSAVDDLFGICNIYEVNVAVFQVCLKID